MSSIIAPELAIPEPRIETSPYSRPAYLHSTSPSHSPTLPTPALGASSYSHHNHSYSASPMMSDPFAAQPFTPSTRKNNLLLPQQHSPSLGSQAVSPTPFSTAPSTNAGESPLHLKYLLATQNANFTQQLNDLQRHLTEREQRIRDLEAKMVHSDIDRRMLAQREEGEKRKLETERNANKENMEKANAIIATTRTELHTLQDLHLQLTQQQRSTTSKLQMELSQAKDSITNLNQQLQDGQELISELRDEKRKHEWTIRDLHRQVTETEVQLMEAKNQLTEQEGLKFLQITVTEQERELKKLHTMTKKLQADNLAMRDVSSQLIVLEEDKKMLEARLKDWFDLKQKLVDLEIENERLKRNISPKK